MKTKILLVILFFVFATNIHAQVIGPGTLNAAGHSTIIGSNDFEWSVGEMTMVNTLSIPGIIITQGVLQPADVKVDVPAYLAEQQQLSVFPNPALSAVNLQYTSAGQGVLAYRLYDMNGKLITNASADFAPGTTIQNIDLSKLANAGYVLEVTIDHSGAAPSKYSYKIEKIK